MVESSLQHQEDLLEKGQFTNISSFTTDVEFWVKNPQDNGGHVTYEVRGRDEIGIWEVKRRYNCFYYLREVLCKRFPAIPIPLVPPKKAIGNKDVYFLQDRTFYLQRFIRKLARWDFILNSAEFHCFSRSENPERSFAALKPLSMVELLESTVKITKIPIPDYDCFLLHPEIENFGYFIKRCEPVL